MFQIDAMSRVPVYEQIVEQTERFLLSGVLAPGTKMPSVRSLSLDLSVNPNTIQKAYSELERRGFVKPVPGKGMFISEQVGECLGEVRKSKLETIRAVLVQGKQAGLTRADVEQCVDQVYRKYEEKRDEV